MVNERDFMLILLQNEQQLSQRYWIKMVYTGRMKGSFS